MDLPLKYKLFWLFICDQCDNAGAWQPNIRLAATQIGEQLELVEILRVFSDRIVQLDDGKLFIIKFIPFQYGNLSPNCRAHIPILNSIEKLRVSKGYPKGIHTLMEKEKEKEGIGYPKKSKSKSRCTTEEVQSFCESIGLPRSDGAAMVLHWTEKKWPKDWKLTIHKWKAFGYLPSQKNFARPTFRKSKEPAPLYPKLPPKRDPSEDELATQRKIVREASEKLKNELNPNR